MAAAFERAFNAESDKGFLDSVRDVLTQMQTDLEFDLRHPLDVLDALPVGGVVGTTSKEAKVLFGLCFASGTPVQTINGLVAIESMREGDLVAARDEYTGFTYWLPVLHLFKNSNMEIVHVAYVDDAGVEEVIRATPQHPFMVMGKGWVAAESLLSGDKILRLEGQPVSVENVTKGLAQEDTYNFEVSGVHTYFVGQHGVWVHNASVSGLAKEAAEAVSPARTIIEDALAAKKADALKGTQAKGYEEIKNMLSQGKAGRNQHELVGDLKGKSAVDLPGSGAGRGAQRVIYSTNRNEVIIHDITDYHK